jgi:hypothetical protein
MSRAGIDLFSKMEEIRQDHQLLLLVSEDNRLLFYHHLNTIQHVDEENK